jgi:hypothetical protein
MPVDQDNAATDEGQRQPKNIECESARWRSTIKPNTPPKIAPRARYIPRRYTPSWLLVSRGVGFSGLHFISRSNTRKTDHAIDPQPTNAARLYPNQVIAFQSDKWLGGGALSMTRLEAFTTRAL